MDNHLSAAVIGLGAVGSATLYQLSKLYGSDVLGIEQFVSPHTLGSSHGETRITRLAIGEGEVYSPLAIRSHQIWREIEQKTQLSLFKNVGGLLISSPSASRLHVEDFFETTQAAAKKYKIPHELLDQAEVAKRFPIFNLDDDESAYYEPDAGYLIPELCVKAQLDLAQANGAQIHMNEKLLSYEQIGKQIKLVTSKGEYTTDKLILTAGSWLPELLPAKYSQLLEVHRQVLFWFNIKAEHYPQVTPENMPIFIWGIKNSSQGIYGFPVIDGAGGGLKVAMESVAKIDFPDEINREVTNEEIQAMYNIIADKIRYLDGSCVKTAVCMYTVTPDHGFVIDKHPDVDGILIVSPCSGHGFKHSAALGEAFAQIVHDGKSKIDLSPFSSIRFTKEQP